MIPLDDSRHEKQYGNEAKCEGDCAACVHNLLDTFAGLGRIPHGVVATWDSYRRLEAASWAIAVGRAPGTPMPPHVAAAADANREPCTCGGFGLCSGCFRPATPTRVDLTDAYGHAIAGNTGMGTVVALMAIAIELRRIRAAIEHLSPPHTAARLNLKATVTDKEGNPVATITQNVDPFTNDLLFQVNPTDSAGNPAPPANTPTWSSSQPSVCALEVAGDGLSAKGRMSSTGVCTVTVSDGVSSDECQVIAQGTPPPPPPGPGPLNLTATLIGKGE